tara:strand:+ start:548 stop:790 length:243 start_codon:yes stop_codon:yes gene_type:complete
MAKSEITKFFQDALGLPDAPTRPYGGAKKGKGWAYPVKKNFIKRSMRWNKDLETSYEAKPVSKELNPNRFRKWLKEHGKG